MEKKSLLVLNAGSSSIKFALFELVNGNIAGAPTLSGLIDGIGAKTHFKAKNAADDVLIDEDLDMTGASGLDEGHAKSLEYLNKWLAKQPEFGQLAAIGHRVLHGGDFYSAPTVIDKKVFEVLESFIPLGPLHQPHNLRPIRAFFDLYPGVPQVACFDTAFHMTQDPLARRFPLPKEFYEQNIKRYGFHGISFDYISYALDKYMDEKDADSRIIIAHLGNGSSLCGIKNRKCVTTTMSFTALDGLMMGTRCGAVDPGMVLYLLEEKKMSVAEVSELLYKKSGLLGVSGISQDMRILEKSDSPDAKTAIDLFIYRIAREMGSFMSAIEGLDGIVFTAGIGENAVEIREDICKRMAWAGVKLNPEANATRGTNLISAPDSKVKVYVIPTNEEWMIARYAYELTK